MHIVVSCQEKWGKQLFYPENEDAVFLTKLTGRPTILKHQLKLALEKGWKVDVMEKKFNLAECLRLDGK